MERKTNIKRLVLTAVMIALAVVLSMVKIFKMPLGGSVTLLSMLPIALISVEYGISWGLTASFAYSLVQMGLDMAEVFSWGLSPMAIVGTIALDYILAYSAIGISGVFRKKGVVGICIGIALALTLGANINGVITCLHIYSLSITRAIGTNSYRFTICIPD